MKTYFLSVTFGILVSFSGLWAKKPNILFIMADDLGWMDLACQGNPLVETPNLDRLAKQGMRFTDAYAAAPVCSPTRCAVLTGQAPARIGLTTHLPGRFFPKDGRPQPAKLTPQLNTEHVTIAERMKEAGYASAFFGKWHIAPSSGRGGKVADAVSPTGQGFDLNVGGTSYGGPPSFFSPYRNAELPGYTLRQADGTSRCVPLLLTAARAPAGYAGDFHVQEFTDAKLKERWAACKSDAACFKRINDQMQRWLPPNKERATRVTGMVDPDNTLQHLSGRDIARQDTVFR